MSLFLFFAALLGLLAVAFAISALWQRSRGLALALAIGLPLAAGALYHFKGQPAAINPPPVVAAPKTIEEAVVQLREHLAQVPDDYVGIVLLARSYMALQKFELARETYAKAMKLKPEESDVSVEYVEAMLRTSPDHRFPPLAVDYLNKAIAKNPGNQRALFFLGMHAMMEHQPAEAAAIWEKLLPLLAPDAAAAVRNQIDQARLQAGLPPLPPTAASPTPNALLEIDVDIDPTLANLARPGDVLYVFARALDGAGPPIAAKRIELDKLPLHLQLTDADSPMPAAKLSSQSQVQLMARLSKSGDVKAASGDIEADPIQVATGAKEPVALLLNRPVP